MIAQAGESAQTQTSEQLLSALFERYCVDPDVVAYVRRPHRMLIGARWRDALSGRRLPVFEPSSAAQMTSIPAGDAHDVDEAVAAAAEAMQDGRWSRAAPADRERVLMRLADRLESDADFLATLETLDNGKPLAASRLDVSDAIRFARYMAGWATKLSGRSMTLSAAHTPLGLTLREPVGVVAAITPWNLPLNMAVQKVIPALVAGCSVILKPAEQTPLSALRLGEWALEAGVPPGVLNIVTGEGPDVGEPLVRHAQVAKVTFTGSTAVGVRIGQLAMANMTRLTLELGGKSPMIVLPDCDLAKAAQGVVDGIFAYAGQICCAASRLLVHARVFEPLMDRVIAHATSLRIGPGLDPMTELGPLVSDVQLKRVTGYIETGVAEGAQLRAGGQGEGPGYFVRPTVLTGADPASRVCREEIFGPVVVAAPFESDEQLIRQANDTRYGLAASIWTNDLKRARELAQAIRAGTVWINTHNPVDPALPFGGYGMSGFGREGGPEQLEAYLETKAVWISG